MFKEYMKDKWGNKKICNKELIVPNKRKSWMKSSNGKRKYKISSCFCLKINNCRGF
jgi:hypothetical protein